MDKKYIIRENYPEFMNTSYYFEDEFFTERSGDFCNNLFILYYDRMKYNGFNADTFNNIVEEAENIIEDFSIVSENVVDNDGKKYTYKKIMEEYGIAYNPKKCHDLKLWTEYAFNYHNDIVDSVKDYLTIKTGKKWETATATGYCQGDYVEMIYCVERYAEENVKIYGEIFLGACKEFSLIELNENGEEEFFACGYFVADCQINREEDYKKIVCDWCEIGEEEAQLQLISDCNYIREYSYKTI